MDYSKYEAEDFVMDEKFRQWVLEYQHDSFWHTFLLDYPLQGENIQQARQLLVSLTLEQESLPATEVEALRMNIHQAINEKSFTNPYKPFYQRQWLKIAAGISGLVLLSAFLWLYFQDTQSETYKTSYGEIKQIELPDGSLVILNANSTLAWHSGKTFHENREVSLYGEAFFDVQHTADDKKFIVHTGHVQVEVLGTTFNVKRRREQTQVVLNTGKVALQNTDTGEKTLMQAGDLVSLAHEEASFTFKKVNPDLYISWKARKLLINNTTLKEIASIIEDTYGYLVIIKGESLEQRPFSVTTTVPLRDLDNLLQLIEMTFKIDITKTKQQIIMEEK